jgi:hypothetical protein
LRNNEEVVRIDLSVLSVIQSFICNKGGREVLGRNIFLRGSSGCLNIGICSFHLVAARKTRVAGWCKGEQVFSVIQVGAYVIGSWCFHPVGVGTLRELVLPSSGLYRNHIFGPLKQVGAYISGSRCFHLVGAGTLRELVLPSS